MQSPIIKQILSFGILTATVSLILACTGFGIVEFYGIRNEATVKLNSQMNMLAYNLQPTLVFDDKESADKILQALRDDPSVGRIVVYRANGDMFAQFKGPNKRTAIKMTRPVIFEKKIIGSLEMEAGFLGVQERYRTYFMISLFIMLISIPASYIISNPIRGQVLRAVVQLEEQSSRLRMLADQVVTTEQRERKRIAALIHDHLQQLLVASKLQLGLTLRAIEKNEIEKAVANLKKADEFINESTRSARTLTAELRPPVLYEDGLVPALRWLGHKFKSEHNVTVMLRGADFPDALPDNLKIMIFESVKEVLFNAVKYAGVDEVEVHINRVDDQVQIRVKDEGRGFDVSDMDVKLADKGFGLFSIRERLKLLSGNLQVVSRPGEGTVVEITVPLAKSPSAVDPAAVMEENTAAAEDHVGGRSIRILLADDHKIVREGIANLLKENRAFNIVAQAENGEEAVEKAELFQPDIVIMDVNMPKLNGIEATRAIKRKFPHMDVIGLSVQDEAGVADSMKKAGALTLVNKAGDPHNLVQAILSTAR